MQQTRNDSLQGLLESLRGQDKEKDVCRRIERDLLTDGLPRRSAWLCKPHYAFHAGRSAMIKLFFEKPGERVLVISLENSSRDGIGLLMGG